jgi:hypothetical protein
MTESNPTMFSEGEDGGGGSKKELKIPQSCLKI